MNKQHLRTALAALLLIGAGSYVHGQTTVDGLTYTLDSEALTATLTGFQAVPDDSIVNIPESIVAEAQTYTVTAIGDKAFFGNVFISGYVEKMLKVKAIIIPKTVKAIGSQAFNIPFYKGGTSIYTACNLESITFAEGSQLESIGKQAFGGKAIFELDLPEGLKTIGEEAFYRSSNLKRIGLPSTLDSIGPNAFYGTDSLRQITLPDGLRAIAERAFYNISELTEVTLPASLRSIGAEAFNRVSLVKPLGATPPTIQSNTFPSYAKVLPPFEYLDVYRTADVWKDLNVTGDSFTDDRGRTFDIIGSDKVRLKSFNDRSYYIFSVTIPESETVVHDGRTFQVAEYAASAFVNVDTLHVERSYTALPAWTFRQLMALYLPATTEDLTAVSFSNSYYGVELHLSSPLPPTISSTDGIRKLILDESLIPAYAGSIWSQLNLNPFSEDGIDYSRLFTVEKNVAVTGSWAKQVVIPATVSHDGLVYSVARINGIGTSTRSVVIASADTKLSEGAFQDTYYLESVELPEGMTTLPANLFYNSGIKNVKIPSTITEIGNSAFYRTTKLRHIDLPEGLTDIRSMAFFGSGIESLHLPASVSKIWELALQASMVRDYTVAESNPHFSAKDGVLFTKDQSTLVAYPAGKLDRHYDMPSTVKHIANAAFYGGCKLTSIRLSENYAGIAENAVVDGYRQAFPQYGLAVYLPRPVDVNILNNFGAISVIYLPATYSGTNGKEIQNLIDKLSDSYTVRFEDKGSLPFEYYFASQSDNVEAVIISAESVRLPHHLNIPAEYIVQRFNSHSSFPDRYLNEEDQCYHIPVVGIADNVFARCDSLVSVTLPAGLKFVGEAAFFGCKNLESVQGLSQMSMTPSIYTYDGTYDGPYNGIYEFAFAECPKLKKLDFGGRIGLSSLHTVGSTSLSEVTIGEAQLEMMVDEEHPYVYVEDGVVYWHIYGDPYRDSEGNLIKAIEKKLDYYPAAREATEFVVPDSVTEILDLAFAYSHLEKLTLPATHKGCIYSAAFYGNHSLKEVVLLADSLSQLPSFSTTEDHSNPSSYIPFYSYGMPYVYVSTRNYAARRNSHGYAWTEEYPSFDFDYTRENTVVYMKQSVIDEYEASVQNPYDFENPLEHENYMRVERLCNRYEAFKQNFKEIRPLQVPTGIESVAVTINTPKQGWYTLDGRRINKPTASGLYIHNGRKTIVK